MESMKNQISYLSKDKYTIKAKSCQTISFMGARPNYFKITNGGNTPLYLGISMMPTEEFFDEKIPSASTKLCVDAYGSEQINILNSSEFDANIIITSFTAPFDASAVAMSGFGIDFTNIEMTGEVDATGDMKDILSNLNKRFSGDKVLGKVGLSDKEKETLNSIRQALFYNGTDKEQSYIQNISYRVSELTKKLLDDNNNEHLQNIYDILTAIQNTEDLKINHLNSINEKTNGLGSLPVITKIIGIGNACELIYNDCDLYVNKQKPNITAPENYYIGEMSILLTENMPDEVKLSDSQIGFTSYYKIDEWNKNCHIRRLKELKVDTDIITTDEHSYSSFIVNVIFYPETNTIYNSMKIETIESKKIVGLDLNTGVTTCDLNTLNLKGYKINKILGVNNSDIQSKVFIRQFIVKENGSQDNAYCLTIDMWNELYAGKGATFFDIECDTDTDAKIIIEVVK